jgi:precorrin-6A/cobalt-precorrin-6A reductase
MILLLGGTSETAPLAEALAEAGFSVLVSTATDVPLDVGDHPGISRRRGPLDIRGIRLLTMERNIQAIVDASHPYASNVSALARRAAESLKIPYFAWWRPSALAGEDQIFQAVDHEDAARIAFSFGRPVLLTTGSRNLRPYVAESVKTGIRLVARVLDHSDSIRACEEAGIPPENVIAGRGPFSLEQNLSAISDFGIGVIVTKDSGLAGGVLEKAEAARLSDCRLVVAQRPDQRQEFCHETIPELIAALKEFVRL